MFNGSCVAVGIIAWNEEEAIASVVKDFKDQKVVDKVIVIDNNSSDDTGKKARKAGALVVLEKKQGYGFACQRALKEAKKYGDIIALVEGDASFSAQDINRLLGYISEYDMVIGTRTKTPFIEKGAKMNAFLRYGNIFLGKLLHIVHSGPSLTDAGCTFRIIRKKPLEKIDEEFAVGGSSFSPHMIILAIKKGLRIKEIPIYYKKRVGTSTITTSYWKSFKLGLRMIWLIVRG